MLKGYLIITIFCLQSAIMGMGQFNVVNRSLQQKKNILKARIDQLGNFAFQGLYKIQSNFPNSIPFKNLEVEFCDLQNQYKRAGDDLEVLKNLYLRLNVFIFKCSSLKNAKI